MVTKFTDFSLKFDRKGQINLNDITSTGLIEIRMYYNGKASYKSTGYRITSDQWNVKKNIPKDTSILRNIEMIISELKTFESEYRAIHKSWCLEEFKRKDKPIPEPPQKKVSFTDFFKEQLDGEKALNQPSLRTRRLTFDYFKKFKENVRFDEMTFGLIQSFDLYLHAQKASGRKLHLNTIKKHHKHVRKYILQAIKHRYIASIDNPYLDFKPPSQPFESNYVTWEELLRIEALTFEKVESMLERCRDMFLFACYTGLRYNDVYKIRPSHLFETSEGLDLNYQANKTKKFGVKHLGILFKGRPESIARKYMSLKDDRTLFKGLANPKVNANLKIIAKRANVQKAIKFKDSRNTFANEAIELMPINMVQDEMQHGMLSTTQGYFKRDYERKKQILFEAKWK
jgi:integrase